MISLLYSEAGLYTKQAMGIQKHRWYTLNAHLSHLGLGEGERKKKCLQFGRYYFERSFGFCI